MPTLFSFKIKIAMTSTLLLGTFFHAKKSYPARCSRFLTCTFRTPPDLDGPPGWPQIQFHTFLSVFPTKSDLEPDLGCRRYFLF